MTLKSDAGASSEDVIEISGDDDEEVAEGTEQASTETAEGENATDNAESK